MITWRDFFWNVASNTTATIIGIIVGVPVALLIERARAARQAKAATGERASRLRIAIRMLDQSLEHNAISVAKYHEALMAGQIPLDIKLDLATWESVRSEVIELLRDATIQAHLGRHFERLQVLRDLHRQLVELSVGINSALSGSVVARKSVIDVIRDITGSVQASTERLRNQLTRF